MRKITLLLLILALALSAFSPLASAEDLSWDVNAPKPAAKPAPTQPSMEEADPNATVDPDATADPDATVDPDATPDAGTTVDPNATPDPDASPEPEAIEWLLVAYYLTERDMGDEGAITKAVRAIIQEHDLQPGAHYLRSLLDTSYPDEYAVLTIEDREAVISGPYFSRDYAVAF